MAAASNVAVRNGVAVAAVAALALWPVQIGTAFGLPAHPLILHLPIVLVPILGIAVIAAAVKPQYTLPVAAFAVIALAATLLTIGAGEAFLETLPDEKATSQTMHDHEDAGKTVRFSLVLLTFVLVGMLWATKRALRTTLTVLAVLFALSAAGFTIRTGHLGAKAVWDEQELTESTK